MIGIAIAAICFSILFIRRRKARRRHAPLAASIALESPEMVDVELPNHTIRPWSPPPSLPTYVEPRSTGKRNPGVLANGSTAGPSNSRDIPPKSTVATLPREPYRDMPANSGAPTLNSPLVAANVRGTTISSADLTAIATEVINIMNRIRVVNPSMRNMPPANTTPLSPGVGPPPQYENASSRDG